MEQKGVRLGQGKDLAMASSSKGFRLRINQMPEEAIDERA